MQVANIADVAGVDPADFAGFEMTSGTRSYLKRCILEATMLSNAKREARKLKIDAANTAKMADEESVKVFV